MGPHSTPPRPKIISKENWTAKRTMVLGKLNENKNIKEKTRFWEPFRIRQIPKGSQDLFFSLIFQFLFIFLDMKPLRPMPAHF